MWPERSRRDAETPFSSVSEALAVYSDRSACRTSTRDARAAGNSDARTAAIMSSVAAPAIGSTPGIRNVEYR
jgi:hypothetical protein